MSKIKRLMKVRLALLSIPVIVVGVNIAAIKSIDPLAALMIESRILAQIDSVSQYPVIRLFNQILPVILAFIAIIIYVSPVFRSLWKQQAGEFDLQEKTVLRLLEMPFYIALFISITWMLGVPVVPLAAPLYGIKLLEDFIVQYTSHSLVLFGFAFVLSYYSVEVIIRRIIIPQALEGNMALSVNPRFSLSIAARLIIFATAAFAIPALVFFNTIRILNNDGDNNFQRDLMVILEIGLPIFSVLIGAVSWMKILSIQAPIRELSSAAELIGKGEYGTRVTVSSHDEIGKLSGAFNDMALGLDEREKMKTLFGKIVDPRIRDSLMASGDLLTGNSGEQCPATIVFFDLAGFTGISESIPPAVLLKILNLYFESVTSCVEARGDRKSVV